MSKRFISAAILSCFGWWCFGAAAVDFVAEEQLPKASPVVAATPASGGAKQAADTATQSKVVDYYADYGRPVKVGDSSAISLVGHVVFHHNGAVITCDSAIRFNESRMECYNNVIINQDSTYIYGDRLEYDATNNMAHVYAPLVKVIDQDATFYTYTLAFNTRTNVGYFTGGGTMLQADNRMESMRGYYYLDTRVMVGVEQVEMSSPDYKMRADSVTYDLNTEVASFFTRSYIWNAQDEFLTARRGNYDRRNERYTFTDSSYILTKTQEFWADSLTYVQPTQDATLLRNIQVVDTAQKAMAFGDFAQYWGLEGRLMLTRDPSVVSYDPQEDTLYMRADSMFLYTYNRFDSTLMAQADTVLQDEDDLENTIRHQPDTTAQGGGEPEGVGESTSATQLALESDTLSTVAKKKLEKSSKEQEKEAKRALKLAERKAKEQARSAKFHAKHAEELAQMRARRQADSLDKALKIALVDSLKQDSLARVTIALDSTRRADSLALATGPVDSLVRRMQAYHNVKVFRKDLQAVCDSLVGFSIDSTLHMYIAPVLWSESNQVMSERVHMYTKNQQLKRAVFEGDPIMASQVDTLHYNQIKGKVMEAYFADGTITRMDANGNGQTYYYQVENEGTPDAYIGGFMTVECADISFYFEDKTIDRIAWKYETSYAFYPMEKLPAAQLRVMKGFMWEAKRRPSLEQVFTRTIRPSQRSVYERLEKPTYPLTEKIDREREQLVKSGVWFDRQDRLSPDAQEFVKSLNN